MAWENSGELLRNTIDSSLDMIQVFEAVRDDAGRIIDFVWVLNNKTSERYYGDVIGKSLLTLNPGVVEEGIFETFKKVVETGEPDQSIRHYVHEQFDGWFLQSAVRQGDGVATTTKDISDIKEAEENLQATLDSSLYVIQAFKAVRNEKDQIIDFTWVFTNDRWNQQYGEMAGKSLLEHNPGVIETGLFEKFIQVTETGITIDHEQYYSHEQFHEQWFHQTLVKMGDGFVMNTEDITARKKAEQEKLEKQTLLESVLNNTESSIMLLKPLRNDAGRVNDFEYVYANEQTLKSVGRTELLGRKMTDEFPEVKNSTLLGKYIEVAENGETFKGEADISPFGYAVSAQVFAQKFSDHVLVTYFDITERKRYESEIFSLKDQIAQSAENKYQTLFNSIDQGYALAELLYNEAGQPVDLLYHETNPAFERMNGFTGNGKKLSEVLGGLEPFWYEAYDRVIRTGQPARIESKTELVNKWYSVYCSRVNGAHSKLLAFIFEDITERKQREESQAFLLQLSDHLRAAPGVEAVGKLAVQMLGAHLQVDRCYISEVFEEDGYSTVGPESLRPGVSSMVGTYRLADYPETQRQMATQPLVIHDADNDPRFSDEQKAMLALVPQRALLVAPLRKGPRKIIWAMAAAMATPRKWTETERLLLEEVAERTWTAIERARTEAALQQRERELARVQEIGQIGGVYIDVANHLTAQRSPEYIKLHGLPPDTTFETHQDWLRRLHPDDREKAEATLFTALEGSGNAYESEYRIIRPDNGQIRWIYAKMDIERDDQGKVSRLVGVHIDITPRKQAEEALRKAEEQYRSQLEKEVMDRTFELKESRDQLQSILDTTLVQMSILQAVRDNDGQIIDLEIKAVNRELEKETGRKDLVGKYYAREYPGIRQTGLFDLIIKTIETGVSQSTEYFYPYEGFNKWFNCVFVKLGDGVVATNMDVSDRKRAEEQLRKMETDKQREIFEVSLSTVEEERHRISESLHNGIGQILYGAKINMTGFRHGMPEPQFKESKTYINQLLTDAIREARRISHELMPTTLEQFGLKSAIDDICEQLSDTTHFHCQVTGGRRRMDKYLELAVYRTTQELMTNVVKHAKATECKVNINISQKLIHISVSDNGQGMEVNKTAKPGIGLASIRSKIKLLSGEVNIESSADRGTAIRVTIPRPQRQIQN